MILIRRTTHRGTLYPVVLHTLSVLLFVLFVYDFILCVVVFWCGVGCLVCSVVFCVSICLLLISQWYYAIYPIYPVTALGLLVYYLDSSSFVCFWGFYYYANSPSS